MQRWRSGKHCVLRYDERCAFSHSLKTNLICRDGGVVERARLEIVLRRNTYGGSNPSLCAKKGSDICHCLLMFKTLYKFVHAYAGLSVLVVAGVTANGAVVAGDEVRLIDIQLLKSRIGFAFKFCNLL